MSSWRRSDLTRLVGRRRVEGGELPVEVSKGGAELLLTPEDSGGFEFAKNSLAGELQAFAFALALNVNVRDLFLASGKAAGLGFFHLRFNGLTFPAARHRFIVGEAASDLRL